MPKTLFAASDPDDHTSRDRTVTHASTQTAFPRLSPPPAFPPSLLVRVLTWGLGLLWLLVLAAGAALLVVVVTATAQELL